MIDAAAVDELVVDLNEAQARAVTTDAAPLCIVAGAGSGKTRVLTRRIAHRCLTGSADPRHVLALTFTRKAAGELVDRLHGLGLRDRVTAGTFHAVAYAQLRTHWAERRVRAPALLDSKIRLLQRVLPQGARGPSARLIARDAAGEIEWAQARLVDPARYAEAAAATGRRPPLGFDEMAGWYGRYVEEKRRQEVVDFDDLLRTWARTIENDAEVAGAQRWRFRHLFVDEFQDVNPLQHRLLEAWRGDRLDLCVVGDPNQAIYAWNGADPRLLVGFAERFPSTEVVVLEHNYRSTPQILATANAVVAAGAVDRPTGQVRSPRLEAQRPDGPIPRATRYASDRHEARAVAASAGERHRPGVPWRHQAVLYRTNAQAVPFQEALQRAGIPYRVRGQEPFLQLPEVREALRALTARGVSFREVLADIEASQPDPDDPTVSDAEFVRADNLRQLLRLADDYTAAAAAPTGYDFKVWLTATMPGEDVDSARDAVELATFHAAKGLEWPVVHVAGLEDGLVPIGHARRAEDLAEERRLFYVAVTRARDELHLSWAALRTFGRRTVPRDPSPYLVDVEPVLSALRTGERPADWRENLARQRERLRTPAPRRAAKAAPAELDPADEPLFDALRRWRADTARAANVPAYVVFHDTTLRAIATARPRRPSDLLAVPGVGEVKAGRFGAAVLALVAEHGPS